MNSLLITLLRIADDWRTSAEALENREKELFLRYFDPSNAAQSYQHIPREELLEMTELRARARALRSCEERLRQEFEGEHPHS